MCGGFGAISRYHAIVLRMATKPASHHLCAAANDAMALGAIKALRSSGIRIPEDVSIIGYDDIPSSALAELTTVRQPFMEMGKSAIMQLYAAIADAHTPKKTTVLPSSIVIRSSCAVLKG